MKNFESFDPLSEAGADANPVIQEVAESQPEIPETVESFLPSIEYTDPQLDIPLVAVAYKDWQNNRAANQDEIDHYTLSAGKNEKSSPIKIYTQDPKMVLEIQTVFAKTYKKSKKSFPDAEAAIEDATYKLLNGKYGLKEGINNKNLIE